MPNAPKTKTVPARSATSDTAAPEPAARSVGRGAGSSWGSRYGLLAAWLLLILVFSLLRPESFLRATTFGSMFSSGAVLLILTLGILPLLAAGELDLSAGGTFGVSIVLVGELNVTYGIGVGWAVLVALAIGLLVGIVNAVLIVAIGIPSIVVTLGMGSLLSGLALGVTVTPISGVSPVLVQISRHSVFGLQMVFFYAILMTILMWYVFTLTPLGRYLFFVGSGRAAARLSGIRVDRVRAGSLVFGGVVSALAGVLFVGLLGSADPSVGPTFLLPAYAAAFLGATALTPGRFNPLGSLLAVYFLATGITGLQILGLSGWVVQAFYGGSLILAVLLSTVLGMRQSFTPGTT
jgi:ribose transport system permease protein